MLFHFNVAILYLSNYHGIGVNYCRTVLFNNEKLLWDSNGATTLSIMTLSITTFSIMTLSITIKNATLSITALAT
jgi:hypothetical protein